MSDFWRALILLVLLLGCDTSQPVVVTEPTGEKLVFLDEGFWDPTGCEDGFGPLTLELQPGQLPYGETFEIRGCVKIIGSDEEVEDE